MMKNNYFYFPKVFNFELGSFSEVIDLFVMIFSASYPEKIGNK